MKENECLFATHRAFKHRHRAIHQAVSAKIESLTSFWVALDGKYNIWAFFNGFQLQNGEKRKKEAEFSDNWPENVPLKTNPANSMDRIWIQSVLNYSLWL